MLRLNNYSALTCVNISKPTYATSIRIDIRRKIPDKSAFIFVKEKVPVEASPPSYESSLVVSISVDSITDSGELSFIGNFEDRELKNFMEPIYHFGVLEEGYKNILATSTLNSNYRVVIIKFDSVFEINLG